MIKITKVVTGEADTEVTVSYSIGKKTAVLTVSESELKLRAQKAADQLKRGVTEQDLLDAVKVVVEEKRSASTVEPADYGKFIDADLEKSVPAPVQRKRVVVPVAYELVPEPPPEPEVPPQEEYPVDPETGLPIIPEPEVPADEKEVP